MAKIFHLLNIFCNRVSNTGFFSMRRRLINKNDSPSWAVVKHQKLHVNKICMKSMKSRSRRSHGRCTIRLKRIMTENPPLKQSPMWWGGGGREHPARDSFYVLFCFYQKFTQILWKFKWIDYSGKVGSKFRQEGCSFLSFGYGIKQQQKT